jgi:hypothetical protein
MLRFPLSRLWVRLLGTVTLALSFGVAATIEVAAAQPSNDEIGGAVDLGGLPFVGDFDSTEATWSPSDPQACPNSSSVWFTFTADRSMTVKLSGAGSAFEPSMTVAIGSPDALSVVACSYQASQFPVTFQTTAGTTYWVMAATCCFFEGSNAGGALRLSLSEVVPPPNDDFANAMDIGALPFTQESLDTRYNAGHDRADRPHSVRCQRLSLVHVHTTGGHEHQGRDLGLPDAGIGVDRGAREPDAHRMRRRHTRASIPGSGGTAVLDLGVLPVSPPPPIGGGLLTVTIRETNEITGVFVDPHASVTRDGVVTLSGTVTCTATGTVLIEAVLSQTFKRPAGTIAALNSTLLTCDGTAFWSLQLSTSPVGFAAGRASVEVRAASFDTFTNMFASSGVVLRRA